ncbi:MAG: HD domain-containing phosphohydrolase [Rhodocyclaceae bacterium]|uniref:HD domain-containing phosphohydrolase n=1 Tax=Sulfuricystis thermophila TaxID=2496847 RepID=UPI0010366795|nr:HD domain-containing phosphohydrolase [Sulfuricystis thermophila]MDI6749601.1 HD domain-containing phosphohydrolase [Rhodocyclaceae bacterium]
MTISTIDPVAAVVRSAQYLAGIVRYDDLWPQLAKLVCRFFGADVAAFAMREADGRVRFLHIEPPGVSLDATASTVAAVFDSGFLASEVIELPAPHAAVLLPLGRERQRTSYVLLAAHCGTAPLPRERLDLYLALAGLIESTLDRIASQQRFVNMANNVPELLGQLMLADGGWHFTYVSGGARTVLGIAPEALLTDSGLLFGALDAADRAALEAALAGWQAGAHLRLTMRWNAPDGGTRHLLANAMATTGEAGERVWDGAIQDISEQVRLQEESRHNLERLNKSMEDAIQAVAATIEQRDPYTAGHQRRVAELAERLAIRLGLPEDTVHGIRLTASIHDIGKIHVPAELLSYPGKLPEVEFALIRQHPRVGYEILKNVDFPWPVAEMVYQHHEHLDGSGYPRGLSGDAILPGARIITVADVVEAIALYRPYRPALGVETALDEIAQHRGTRYDPAVVDACLALFREEGFSFS